MDISHLLRDKLYLQDVMQPDIIPHFLNRYDVTGAFLQLFQPKELKSLFPTIDNMQVQNRSFYEFVFAEISRVLQQYNTLVPQGRDYVFDGNNALTHEILFDLGFPMHVMEGRQWDRTDRALTKFFRRATREFNEYNSMTGEELVDLITPEFTHQMAARKKDHAFAFYLLAHPSPAVPHLALYFSLRDKERIKQFFPYTGFTVHARHVEPPEDIDAVIEDALKQGNKALSDFDRDISTGENYVGRIRRSTAFGKVAAARVWVPDHMDRLYARQSDTYERQIGNISQKLSSARQSLADHAERMTGYRQQIQELHGTVRSLEARLARASVEKSDPSLKRQIRNLSSKLEGIEVKYGAMEEEYENLRIENRSNLDMLDLYEAEVESMEREIERLQTENMLHTFYSSKSALILTANGNTSRSMAETVSKYCSGAEVVSIDNNTTSFAGVDVVIMTTGIPHKISGRIYETCQKEGMDCMFVNGNGKGDVLKTMVNYVNGSKK